MPLIDYWLETGITITVITLITNSINQWSHQVIVIDQYYYLAYPITGVVMYVLGRAFVFFVTNNLPFPEHQPRPIWEEVSWGIFACGVIQYLSGAIYHWNFTYEVYAGLYLLNSAVLFLIALGPGGVGSVYTMRRKISDNGNGSINGESALPLDGKEAIDMLSTLANVSGDALTVIDNTGKGYKLTREAVRYILNGNKGE